MNTKKPRGSIFLFTVVLAIPLMLVMAGIAVDVAMLFATRSELHRAMDAAALAGAGKLGFDSTDFPAARQYAQNYAGFNKYLQSGQITLNQNPGNDPAGDIVLGIWDGTAQTFTPSLDGTMVNAVQCRTTQSIPTYFLNMVGLNSLSTSATSIAVSNPPTVPPACLYPIGFTSCPFENNGAWSSIGCGVAISFISSSGKNPGPPPGTNTGAWLALDGGSAGGSTIRSELAGAYGGSCTTNPAAGATVTANNGMIQPALDDFEADFVAQYNLSDVKTITDSSTPPKTTYQGKGWTIVLPMLNTDCPPKAINGSFTIQTFAYFTVTQVFNQKGCAVNNPALTTYDPDVQNFCNNPPNGSSSRAIFGHFDCSKMASMPSVIPTPRSALATRLRLVQ